MKSATLLALLFATTGLAAIPGMFEEEQAPHQVMNAMRKRDDDAQIKKFDNPEDGLCCCTDLKATYCACYDKTEAKCNPDDSIGTCFNKCWA